MLEIVFNRNPRNFSPGESLDLEIRWETSASANTLELRLVCNTVGKGDQDVAIVQNWLLPEAMSRGSERLSLTLPEKPHSFSGTLISLVWAVELICLTTNESIREEITIGPAAQEVLITETIPTQKTFFQSR